MRFIVLSWADTCMQFACMEVIKRWLNGPQNFIVGRLYYKQFGKDKNLQALFDKGETAFAKTELEKALRALLTEEKKPAKLPEKLRLDTMPKGNDEVTRAIELEWRPEYQRMKYLIHELDKYGDDNSEKTREECRLIAEEILTLEQHCIQCWDKLDKYKSTGKLPEIKEVKFIVPDDPVELAKKIQTLERNIRRNKQKAEENPANPKYPSLVAEYEKQLQLALQSPLIKPKS